MRPLPLLLLLFSATACGSSAAPAETAQASPCGVTDAGAASEGASSNLPRLTGRVVDGADLLPGDVEARLTSRLAALEARTRDQLIVVTTLDLHGETIEHFGLRLGKEWRPGRKDIDNGVLLIVAPRERKVRIEVGCGLEGLLTDARAKRIIEDAITPSFASGDFPGGIEAGTGQIIATLQSTGERPLRRATKRMT